MIQVGKINNLAIKRLGDYGAHLDGGGAGDVFMPQKYIPKSARPGDEVEVFVYADRDERLRATTQKPFATVGQFAKLRVVATSSVGAYLDWGLQKDLLVPMAEQRLKMEEGKAYVVYVFLEERGQRIAASSKLDKYLSRQPPNYQEGQEVDLFICEKTDLGYKAVVNASHWGIVYKNEVFQTLRVGQALKGYIKKIRDDQRIDLSLQKTGAKMVIDTSQSVLDTIKLHGGSMAVSDKSPPEEIYSLFGVSKKAFKKAVGALYKRRLISVTSDSIILVKKRPPQGG